MIRILCSPNSQSLIKLYQEVIVYKNIHTIFYAAFFSIFSTSILAAPTYDVFSEDFGTDWSSQPWGATVTVVKPPTRINAFRGKYSAKVEFNSSMGVFKTVATGGFNTSGYRHLTFAVYNERDANDLWFAAQSKDGVLGKYLKVSDYADKFDLPQGKWSWISIPVSHMGLGSSPSISFFSVASGSAGSRAYFDDVGFSTSTILYEGRVNDSYGPGIQLWHWDGIISKSIDSLTMTTTKAWGGLQFQRRVADLRARDYGAVALRIKSDDIAKPHQFRIYLTDKKGKPIGNSISLDSSYLKEEFIKVLKKDWLQFTIKISEFELPPASIPIGGIIIRAVEPTKFQVDDVRFVRKLNWVMEIDREVSGFKFGEQWLKDDDVMGYCNENPKLHVGNDYNDGVDSGRSIYAASQGVVKLVQEAVLESHGDMLSSSSMRVD